MMKELAKELSGQPGSEHSPNLPLNEPHREHCRLKRGALIFSSVGNRLICSEGSKWPDFRRCPDMAVDKV